VIKGHRLAITAMTYDKATHNLFTASYDGLVLRWNIDDGSSTGFSGKPHTNSVVGMVVSNCGSSLITTSQDDSVMVSDLKSQAYGADKAPTGAQPCGIAAGVADAAVAVVATNNSILVLRDGKLVNTHPVDFQPTCIALSPDCTNIGVGGADMKVHKFSLEADVVKPTDVIEQHRGALTAVAFSACGTMLASADANREICVWDGTTLKSNMQFHNSRITSVAFSPDSTKLVSGSLDTNVFIWDLVKGNDARVQLKGTHIGGVSSVLWLDDRSFVTAGADCCIRRWEL
jgi:WD40 repeat protein